MSEQRKCKKFAIEITEGGKCEVRIDDQVIPGITGYYISGEHSENELDIDLYQVDADGFMTVMTVAVEL